MTPAHTAFRWLYREERQNLQLYHVNVLVHLNVNVPEQEHQDFRERSRLRARARSRAKFQSETTGGFLLASLDKGFS
jgi:hypothetical protein